jgi:glycosidase
VKNAKYPDIEAKLPELANLGINTILLQPFFKSKKKRQGYDIIDYFSLREELGTEEQLQSLITTAKYFADFGKCLHNEVAVV